MTLEYIATSRDRDQPGYVYRHGFGTGWQDLVFASHAAAQRFAVANGIAIRAAVHAADRKGNDRE